MRFDFTEEENEVFRFASDFTVDHIAIDNSNNIAALSLGSKGIALSFVTKGDFAKWKEIQKILNPGKDKKNQSTSKKS